MDFKIVNFEKLDSTNTYAKMYYKAFDHKTVVVAKEQTHGYGRFRRNWTSTNKDLTFSIIFKDPKKKHNLIAPLAIINALAKLKVKAMIKWPNDIIVDQQKIAGILVESLYEGKDNTCSVVGIGVNIFKKEKFISINDFYKISAKDFLKLLLNEYDQLLDQNDLINKYRNECIIFKEQIEYRNQRYHMLEISDEGHLVLFNGIDKITITSEEITLTTIYENKHI